MQHLFNDIRDMRDNPFPDERVADAKRALIDAYARSLESTDDLAGYAIARWRFKLPADYWETYRERIGQIDAAAVQEAARRHLAAGQLTVVIAGDPKIADTVKEFSPPN
jgi:predicted Zn-dependent peptidase